VTKSVFTSPIAVLPPTLRFTFAKVTHTRANTNKQQVSSGFMFFAKTRDIDRRITNSSYVEKLKIDIHVQVF
jgi:hypothetical protein